MPASPTVRNPITGATPARLQRRGQGFSLVETLVVIGIISILVSLVVASGFYLNGRAKQSQTRGILAALAAIDTEYRAQTGKAINHTGTDPMDWGQSYTTKYANGATYTGVSLETGTNINYSIERFIIAAKQVSQTASMIDNLANNMADTEKASDEIARPQWLVRDR
jgi:prepilin-type N-terminal cleavage/methylation domain-containing protein